MSSGVPFIRVLMMLTPLSAAALICWRASSAGLTGRKDTCAVQRRARVLVPRPQAFLPIVAERDDRGDAVLRVQAQLLNHLVVDRQLLIAIPEVRMPVDQSGYDGLAGEIDPRRACGHRHRPGRANRLDAAAGNEHGSALERRSTRSVDHASARQSNLPAGGRLRFGNRERRCCDEQSRQRHSPQLPRESNHHHSSLGMIEPPVTGLPIIRHST
jgi:hypothetical protein